jgi:glycosyltransferase involved in cell wall biosynthesis
MTRIAILNMVVSADDAVGNDVLEMRRVLSAHGHTVVLFSSHWAQANAATRDIAELPAFLGDDPQSLLIYHHAIGWTAGIDLLRRTTCRRVVKYHNVTPGRFFAGFSNELVRICQRGREHLRDLARARCELYLSDSACNQSELLDAGADPTRCTVVPPFHHIDRLDRLNADAEVLRRLDDGCANLLFVGRRVPNKGHRFLLDAFAIYHEYYNRDSRLVLIGKEDRNLVAYSNQLREQASRLGILDRVVFLDGVTDAQLKAYYKRASAFVVASEHEGFCVPLVEAMALRVPIVAYGVAAVAHTVGDAGLIWDEPDPFLLAQSLDTVIRDRGVRRQLIERGWRRYRERFSNQRIEDDFLRALRALAA